MLTIDSDNEPIHMVYVPTMALRFSPYNTLSLLRCLHAASLSYFLRFSTWPLCVPAALPNKHFALVNCGEVPAVRAGLSLSYFLRSRLTHSLWAEPRPIQFFYLPHQTSHKVRGLPQPRACSCAYSLLHRFLLGVLDPLWCLLCCCCTWLYGDFPAALVM